MLKSSSIASLLVAVITSSASAATWTGTNDSTWTDLANWGGGPLPGVAEFTGPPTANQPSMGAGRGVTSLDFATAGWTISGSGFTLTVASNSFVHSAGPGTNIIDANLTWSGSSTTSSNLTIADDNTLIVTGNLSMGGGASKSLTGGPNKTGTLITYGTVSGLPDVQRPFSHFVNSIASYALSSSYTFPAGRGFGGTVANLPVNNTQYWTPGTDAFLSPGFDPTQPFSTMTFTGGGNGSGVNMTGAKLIMDIGTSLGINDQIIAGNQLNRGSGLSQGFRLTNSELALRGSTIEDGDYILLLEAGTGQYSGTFASMTFNGLPADPNNFSLTYNPTSVVLHVTGMNIPEPASLSLLTLAALPLLRRRQRRYPPQPPLPRLAAGTKCPTSVVPQARPCRLGLAGILTPPPVTLRI